MVEIVGPAEPAVRENHNQYKPMHRQRKGKKTVRQNELSSGEIKRRASEDRGYNERATNRKVRSFC